MIAAGCTYEEAAEALKSSANHVKTAIVMKKLGLNPLEAKEKVEQANGFVKKALDIP